MSIVFSQVVPAHYRVTFRDKNHNPFSLNNPSEFLSQRAIERRQKTTIQITENDIPIISAVGTPESIHERIWQLVR